jgi:hypothetical protein
MLQPYLLAKHTPITATAIPLQGSPLNFQFKHRKHSFQLLYHYILCIVSLKIDKTVNQIDNKKKKAPITKPDNLDNFSIIPFRQPN